MGRLAISLKALAVAVPLLVFYYQDLSLVFGNGLKSEATNYVLLIPFLVVYFLYRKRKMLRATISYQSSNPPKNTERLATLSGVLLCATAFVLYWYGSYTFSPLEYHVLTLPVFAMGLVLVMFNPQTLRQLAFPIAFLVFLVPPPSEALYSLGSALSVAGSQASSMIVNSLGVSSRISSVYANPTIIITRPDKTLLSFSLDIACSGIYPIMGFLLFATLVAYITRDKTWKKAAVFLVGLPLMYLLNIARISGILLIGFYYGQQLALQVFHLLGGLVLIILGTLIVLVIAEKLFKTNIFTKVQASQPCPKCTEESEDKNYCYSCGRLLKHTQAKLNRNDALKIAAIATTLILLMSIQAPVFALTKGPAQTLIQTPMGQQGSTQILPQVQGYSLDYVYRDQDFEKVAGQDASLLYIYNSRNQTRKSVWVAVEIASSTSSLHRWEVCLITWPQSQGTQPQATQLDLRDTQILQNPPMTARYFAFQYTNQNQTQLVLYWYETTTFMTNGTAEQKQVEISLVTYPDTPSNVTEEESRLLPFATAIANYWQPIKTWTQVALAISQNGLTLTASTITLLACITIFNGFENMRNKKAKTYAYKKLPRADQQIVESVIQAGRTSTPTLQNIAATYQNTTNIPRSHTCSPNQQALLQKLSQAEEIGVVSRQIISQQDEPIQVWKARIR